jgi:chromatin remodeling complex protein RSC6
VECRALSITKRVLDLSPDLAAVIGKNKATRPEAVAGL